MNPLETEFDRALHFFHPPTNYELDNYVLVLNVAYMVKWNSSANQITDSRWHAASMQSDWPCASHSHVGLTNDSHPLKCPVH